jgi:hypothetical protein
MSGEGEAGLSQGGEGRGARMNHQWDGKLSAYDVRPVLSTEIEPAYLSAEDARPVLPTEIERPYPSAIAGSAYQPTHAPAGLAPEPVRFDPGISAPQPRKSCWRRRVAGQPNSSA